MLQLLCLQTAQSDCPQMQSQLCIMGSGKLPGGQEVGVVENRYAAFYLGRQLHSQIVCSMSYRDCLTPKGVGSKIWCITHALSSLSLIGRPLCSVREDDKDDSANLLFIVRML